MKPFISLCMIVKNEEKVIERCLSSVSSLVDEIIVIDTGSRDRTKELVAQYTDKIYDFEWIDDFSAARNYAASKASGEWILVLDADEYVDEENFKEFIIELKTDDGQYDSYYAKIINFTGDYGEYLVQNFHDRVYKNNGQIEYYRKIHEQLRDISGRPLKNKESSLVIFHSGYLKHVVHDKNKNQRNKELLHGEMKCGNNKAFDYFNLGNEYSALGEYEKALNAYLEAFKLKRDFRLAWVSTTLIQIILCLITLKRYNDALNVIRDANDIYVNSPEFPYLKGEVYYQRGQFEDAKITFQHIVNHKEKYSDVVFRPDLKDERPHLRLGQIYLYEEDYNNAIYHFTSVLNVNKYNEESIKKVIYILNKFHSNEEIISFLYQNQLVNSQNISSYVRACFEVANPKLALDLLTQFPENNDILKQIALLKQLCIDNEGEISELNKILNKQVLQKLIESSWINEVDLFLLSEYIIRKNIYNKYTSFLTSLEDFVFCKKLKDFFGKKITIDKLDGDLIIFSLQILLLYKKFSLCNQLLFDIEKANEKILGKVAGVLYYNGFKVEALQLYDKINWDYLENQDLINIINSLLETNNIDGAIQVAQYAAIVFENDFRFYQYILEHTDDRGLFNQTKIRAEDVFGKSIYLEKLNLLSGK